TPLGTFSDLAQQIIPHMSEGTILTDTGSVKQSVIDAIVPLLKDREDIAFIPAHPIAGTEESGVDAGFAELFQKKKIIFTPLKEEDSKSNGYKALSAFWEKLGAQTELMDVAHHDQVFAVVSHIPHLIAYNIVGTAANLEQVSEQEVIKYSASGFRDFTRLASSDPIIWRDVFIHNKEAVLDMLGRFVEDLFDLQRAIRYGDTESLEQRFEYSRTIRKQIIDAGQDSPVVNFARNIERNIEHHLEDKLENKKKCALLWKLYF
ncbi:MAG: prephenate dehydrogenase/arogenate dehydrogenase family protein, partial [Pseudomonadota bacterium]